MTARPGAEATFLPFNRKYLGSKRLLREWIVRCIIDRTGAPGTFLDGFCGTGAVGLEMARRGAGRIVAVDSLVSNCAILAGFAAGKRLRDGRDRINELLASLNSLPPSAGYITESFAGTYFTVENCRRMDSIREEIERLRARGALSEPEHAVLLASFLLAADRVANTIGQYDAFLKHIDTGSARGRPGSRRAGKHLIDERVHSRFQLQPLAEVPGPGLEVIHGDMTVLAPSIPADVAYFDPPYNHRQYCDNYHVLENLAAWRKPPVFGKTRKFDRTGMQSPFSRRPSAAAALEALVAATAAPDVFLSYSSEGILDRGQILGILGRRGTVEEIETEYPVFGNGAGVSVRRSVTERLYHLRIGR